MSASYVVEFPCPAEWITPNQREHWAVKAEKTRTWRSTAAVFAKMQHIPTLDRIEVIAEACYSRKHRRDVDRISLTVKACIDGLVDAGVVEDDDSRHVVEVRYREGGRVTGPARLRLIIVDRGELDGAA